MLGNAWTRWTTPAADHVPQTLGAVDDVTFTDIDGYETCALAQVDQ